MIGKALAAGTVCVLVLAASAGAGASVRTGHGHVVLTVTVSGVGIVQVNGKAVKIFGKHEVNCPMAPGTIETICKRWFHVRRGNRVTLVATPQKGGKHGPWAGACKGTAAKCTLTMNESKQVSATFIPRGARSNPYPLATPGTVYDGLGNWSLQILGSSQQGNDLVVDVKGTLSQSTVNSWTLGLAYQAYVREGPKDEVPIGGPGVGCSAADNSFLSVGANVSPWGTGYVTGGQTVTGKLCFPVVLPPEELVFAATAGFPPPAYPGPSEPPYPPPPGSVWFALH